MKPHPYAKKAHDQREEMVLAHAPLIKRIVTRMAARLPPNIQKEELYQVGMLGLLDAIDKFDPSKDVQFETYAEFRIKGAVLDELRAMDWIPRSVRSAATQLENAYVELTSLLQREPTDKETAAHLKMSLDDYYEFLNKARPIPLLALEDFGSDSDEDGQNVLDILSDPNVEDPFTQLSVRQKKEALVAAIQELAEQEQLVMSLYYDEEMNMKEIGEILGLSESRVSQIRTQVIVKLRTKLKQAHE